MKPQSSWPLRLKAGELVEVRRLDEIVSTLTPQGDLFGLPFMPEMVKYCGRRMRVFKRLHKTCDLQYGQGGLSAEGIVHLRDARCDGAAHGGCQASCTLLWREEWLRRAAASQSPVADPDPPADESTALPIQWTLQPDVASGARPRYRCQVTEQARYTRPLKFWDLRQYVNDVRSRNVSVGDLAAASVRSLYRNLIDLGIGYRVLVKLYNSIQRRRGGLEHPYVLGELSKTPERPLDLRPGDRVRIRPFREIMQTLDGNNKNRGLWFVPQEMGEHCNGQAVVATRVERILSEKTGEMLDLKSPCVILDGIYCRGLAIPGRVLCPRASALFWREIWLERDGSDSGLTVPQAPPASTPPLTDRTDS